MDNETVAAVAGHMSELLARAVKAEQQRDELLRVLKGLLAFCPAETNKQDRAVLAARVALTKIEGENNAKG